MKKNHPVVSFTIYLAAETVRHPKQLLKQSHDGVLTPLTLPDVTAAFLFEQRRAAGVAPAQAILGSYLPDAMAKGAPKVYQVILCQTGGRWFAIPFGQGRHHLRTECLVRDFGLWTCLNALDPKRLRGLGSASLNLAGCRKLEQMGRGSQLPWFSFDTRQEILKAVEGACRDAEDGLRMCGTDGLRVSLPFEPDNLGQILRRYLTRFGQDTYRAHFPWVDRYRLEKDQEQIDVLDYHLVEKLNRAILPEDVLLALPRHSEPEQLHGYTFNIGDRVCRPWLSLSDYLGQRSRRTIALSELKKHKVCMIGESPGAQRLSVYRCLTTQIPNDQETYLLHDGQWYALDRDYVQFEEDAWSRIPKNLMVFPARKEAEDEGQYNQRLTQILPNVTDLHKCKTFRHGDGNSQFELCDAIDKRNKVLLFNKIYHGSSSMSHLFSQVYATAEGLLNDARFRRRALAHYGADLLPDDFGQRPNPSEWHLVLGILQDRPGPLRLPLLARINLVELYRKLHHGMQFQVSITKIETCRKGDRRKPGHGRVIEGGSHAA